MDPRVYFQQQIGGVRRLLDNITADLTDDQFNWSPPGTISPASALLLHVVSGEDFYIQTVIQGQPRLWEAQGWGAKVGVQSPPRPGSDWEVFKTLRLPLAPMLDYQRAVRPATDAYLARLTEDELCRSVNFANRIMPVSEVLMTLVVHTTGHAGEIAAIKGFQGAKGLPY